VSVTISLISAFSSSFRECLACASVIIPAITIFGRARICSSSPATVWASVALIVYSFATARFAELAFWAFPVVVGVLVLVSGTIVVIAAA
jgi:hypothetical protein